MPAQLARGVAAGRERHRADLRIEIGERHPHRDRLLGVERPVELILVPRRVTAAGLLEQCLVVVEAHAAHAEQIGRRLREPRREHEPARRLVDAPQVEALEERGRVGVTLVDRTSLAAPSSRPLPPSNSRYAAISAALAEAGQHRVARRRESRNRVRADRVRRVEGGQRRGIGNAHCAPLRRDLATSVPARRSWRTESDAVMISRRLHEVTSRRPLLPQQRRKYQLGP